MNLKLIKAGLIGASLSLCSMANAALMYANDSNGNVVSWNTDTNAVTNVGSVASSGFNVSQIIGSAWDYANNMLLLTDRNSRTVYSMNTSTGVTTSLFSTNSTFQGAAVKGGVLYGLNESTQQLEAYNIATGAEIALSSSDRFDHAHGVGINTTTGQLYVQASNSVYEAEDDGSKGSLLVDVGSFSEDIAWLNNSIYSVRYGSSIYQTNITTGITTTAVTLGLGQLSGIVVAESIGVNNVPEPTTLAVFALGLIALTRRQFKHS